MNSDDNQLKVSSFSKYCPPYWPYRTMYCWNCPDCDTKQVELCRPRVGDKVMCVDCDRFWEVGQ
jgi:hypothetical protein